jgi:hypothetical protein
MDLSAWPESSSQIVLQTFAPGSDWETGGLRVVPGSSQHLCVNRATEEWLVSLDPEKARSVLGDVHEIRCKTYEFAAKMRDVVPASVRRLLPPLLFLQGTPNQIPHAILDLVYRGIGNINVQGVTFFLGAMPYRFDRRRVLSDGRVVDGFGSNGRDFRLCRSMADNRADENRILIQNLVLGEKITGDQGFMDSVTMPNSMYLERLDVLYGAMRR